MPCIAVKIGSERRATIVCFERSPRKRCVVCRAPANYLCDWPLPTGRTCDAPLCAAHTQSGGPNVDYCPGHGELFERVAQP